jgi:hypothetical protein
MPSSAGGIAPIGQNLDYQTNGGTLGGSWITGNLAYYGTGSGFGVKNTNQQGAGEEDISPEHATDNKEVLDLLVIELPTLPVGTVWDLEAFKLGWAQENGAGTSADVSMFIGGKNLGANYDFAANNVCMDFSGGACAGMNKLSTLGGGFTDITAAIANSGNNIVQDTTTTVNTAATGNYLIVSGRLGDKDDAFKFKSITATQKVPVPGTLALLGLGLIGLVANRRRTAVA